MLARCLVEPLVKDNIRVNCICPGPVRPPQWDAGPVRMAGIEGISPEEVLKRRMARIPLGRAVTMEEIANVALFLASDKALSITGVALAADGGFTAI